MLGLRTGGRSITFNIPRELSLPEYLVAFWSVGQRTALVSVPEAPVHEKNSPPPGKDDIRFSREVSPVNLHAESQPPNYIPHRLLRLRVLATDAGHIPTSTFWG
jgi:hypothetical protein